MKTTTYSDSVGFLFVISKGEKEVKRKTFKI